MAPWRSMGDINTHNSTTKVSFNTKIHMFGSAHESDNNDMVTIF